MSDPGQVMTALNGVSVTRAIPAIYYAMRLITNRHKISDIQRGFKVKGIPSEPSEEDEEIAIPLVRKIEFVEGVPLQELSEEKADQYIVQPGAVLQRLTTQDLSIDEARVK